MKSHLKMASLLTNLLENKFEIFGYRFGLDPLLGLAAGVGDMITALIGLYFVWIGIQLKVPPHKLAQMLWNLGIDFAIGAIPIIGDLFDFGYKAHSKNMKILEDYYVQINGTKNIKART